MNAPAAARPVAASVPTALNAPPMLAVIDEPHEDDDFVTCWSTAPNSWAMLCPIPLKDGTTLIHAVPMSIPPAIWGVPFV